MRRQSEAGLPVNAALAFDAAITQRIRMWGRQLAGFRHAGSDAVLIVYRRDRVAVAGMLRRCGHCMQRMQ